tara:strand:- start:363 stop:518 length:156 start_codon:yes stop_codon:yes gene_type:complete
MPELYILLTMKEGEVIREAVTELSRGYCQLRIKYKDNQIDIRLNIKVVKKG